MKKTATVKIEWEVGDKCFDKLHKQEAIVIYVHPTKKTGDTILIQHTSDDMYLGLKSADDLETVEEQFKEMTVEEVSELVDRTVKIVD